MDTFLPDSLSPKIKPLCRTYVGANKVRVAWALLFLFMTAQILALAPAWLAGRSSHLNNLQASTVLKVPDPKSALYHKFLSLLFSFWWCCHGWYGVVLSVCVVGESLAISSLSGGPPLACSELSLEYLNTKLLWISTRRSNRVYTRASRRCRVFYTIWLQLRPM